MIARWIVAVLLSSLFSGAGAYFWGYHHGETAVQAQTSSATVAKLGEALAEHAGLVSDSKAASLRISKLLAGKAKFDQQTTQELRDALHENADLRADLRYSERVMQQLVAARERAINAATGGLGNALQRPPPVPDQRPE